MSNCCSLYDSDVTGSILKPTLAGSNQPPGQPEKLVSDDLDSSLANLVGSEFDALRCFSSKCTFVKAFSSWRNKRQKDKYFCFSDLGIGNGSMKK